MLHKICNCFSQEQECAEHEHGHWQHNIIIFIVLSWLNTIQDPKFKSQGRLKNSNLSRLQSQSQLISHHHSPKTKSVKKGGSH